MGARAPAWAAQAGSGRGGRARGSMRARGAGASFVHTARSSAPLQPQHKRVGARIAFGFGERVKHAGLRHTALAANVQVACASEGNGMG